MMLNSNIETRDGCEPITSMWIEDKRLLCRTLDVRHRWKDLASQRDLQFTQNDVLLLDQSRAARSSPTEELLDAMYEKKRTTMLDLYKYLAQANLLSAMEIIKKYIPMQYHNVTGGGPHTRTLPQQNVNPVGLTPSAPPPLDVTTDNQLNPQHSMMPPELVSPGAPISMLNDDSLSGLEDMSSTQVRAGHTIIATRNFPLEDIIKATKNFDKAFCISEPAEDEGVVKNSCIYKVVLQNTPFAAKVYNLDYNSVLSDLQDTRHHNHKNIVPITGKCLTGDRVILLYELMTNGSLRSQLEMKGVLSMDRRANILLGAARGLQYLHSNKPPLLHRNIKSKNILLDDGFKAKLSDFGLAVHANKRGGSATTSTDAPDNSSQPYTHFSTREDSSVIQRNKGYCSREVVSSQKFSTKSDTFAFGVVMLETLTGLKAYDSSRPIADQELVNLIENREQERKDFWALADKSIRWEEKTYVELFLLARQCAEDRPKLRPTMDQVYNDLQEIIANMHEEIFGADEEMPGAGEAGPTNRPSPEEHPSSFHGLFAGPATYHGSSTGPDTYLQSLIGPATCYHYPQHDGHAPPPAMFHCTDLPGQSLPAGYYNFPPPHHQQRFPIESHTTSLPHIPLVQTQISATNSSMSDLSLSLPLSEGPAQSPNSHSPNVVHRQTVTADDEYTEISMMPATADFSDMSGNSMSGCDTNSIGDLDSGGHQSATFDSHQSTVDCELAESAPETPRDLFDYLLEGSTDEDNEEGSELDPALLEELNGLDLRSAG